MAGGSWPDPLISLAVTPEVMEQGLEADGYQLVVSAFTWGYALVRMEAVARMYIDVPDPKPATSYRAPLNQIGWQRELSTPADTDMPTASRDTLYLSSVVHLTEPYVLTVPDTADRYYVVDFFDMWQNLQHYVGRRVTGTKPGKFAAVPPEWNGDLPEGVIALPMKTDKVWLWGRIQVNGGEDLAPIHQLQDQFLLEPLSGIVHGDALDPMPNATDDVDGFLELLAFALKYNPVQPEDEALFGQLARIGLTKDGYDKHHANEAVRRGMERGYADAPAVCGSNFASCAEVRGGWFWVLGLDDFGFNYPLRSNIAGPYLGGQGEKESMYPVRHVDSDGNKLTGGNKYVIQFREEPPCDAFWSLTVYDDETKMLVPSSQHWYQIGPNVPRFTKAADGSFQVPVQRDEPSGEFKDNWLKTPEGDFYIIFRLFQPSEKILDGTWTLPQVEIVQL